MAVFNNSISQWVNGDIVDQTELNNLTQDLYQRLSAITDFTANRYTDYRKGVILYVKGRVDRTYPISIANGVLTVGNGATATDNYAIAVRFPNNNLDLKQPGNGIFGFLPVGSNTIPIPSTPSPYTGYAWLTYTITNSSGNNATNVVVPVLNIGTALPTGNAVVVATITAGIVDTTKTPNYLITQAADATDITNLANNVALTPALFPAAPQVLFQQGRLTGISNSPYGDTTRSATLYFTPTEQGNLISLYNGTSWVTQTFTETTQSISGLSGNYDIFITSSSTSTTGITISPIAWNNTTPPAPANRTRLSNGRWVYTGAPQSLLIGSINVTGGVVQSWTGNRSIFNIYNQVSLLGQAYIYNAGVTWIPPDSTTYTTFGLPRPTVTNVYGTKQIGLLVDPLVKDIKIRHSGQSYSAPSSLVNTRFSVSFGINSTTLPIHPLIQIVGGTTLLVRGGATADGDNYTNTIEFDFLITDVTSVPISNDTTTINNGFTNTNIVGFNNIYRLESSGYANAITGTSNVSMNDNKGLIIEFWG